MSRIGKLPVPIPDKVKVTVQDRTVNVEGPLGRLDWTFPYGMTVTVDGQKNEVRVERPDDQRRHRALHGLTRALIANMVEGVIKGYERRMQLYGTGYSVNVQGKKIVIQCGFAHSVEKDIPGGIEVDVEVPATRGNDTPARWVSLRPRCGTSSRRSRIWARGSGTRANRFAARPARRLSAAPRRRKDQGRPTPSEDWQWRTSGTNGHG